MSKKILAMVLALIMVLGTMPVLALFSSADGTKVEGTVTRGDNGADVSDWMTDGQFGGAGGNYADISWAGTGYNWSFADGVLTVGGVNIGESGSKQEQYPWNGIRDEVTKVVVLPGTKSVGKEAFCHMNNVTEIIVGEGVEVLCNDCFAYGSGKLEVLSLPSTLTTVKQGVCWGNNPAKIILNGISKDDLNAKITAPYTNVKDHGNVEERAFKKIKVDKWSDGFENWPGSSTKPEGDDAATQLLPVLLNEDDSYFDPGPGFTWHITILRGCHPNDKGNAVGAIAKDLVFDGPTSSYLGLGINRFEICLGEGENQFVPQNGAVYTVAVNLYDEGGALAYSGISEEGTFKCTIDPIYHGKTYTPQFANPQCYVESDFGSPMAVCAVGVGNYVGDRYYQFEIYGSDDNTLPIGQWTLIGEKKDGEKAAAQLSRVDMTMNVEDAFDEYRYVRVYGTFDSANGGYHFSELSTEVFAGGIPITFVYGDGQQTIFVEEGTVPEYNGPTGKATDYAYVYKFAGWDKELASATEPTTYTAVYTTAPGTKTAEIDSYYNIIENWNGNTQFLLTANKKDVNGENDYIYDAYKATRNGAPYRWVLTVDGTPYTCAPTSDYDFGGSVLLRFPVCTGGDVFVPEAEVEYTATLDVYDMAPEYLEEYGSAGYHLFTSANEITASNGADAITYDYATITWYVDGALYGTTLAQSGAIPTFPGEPLPYTKVAGGRNYILDEPVLAKVTGDATYEYEYLLADGEATTTWIDERFPENNYTQVCEVGSTLEYEGGAKSYQDGYFFYEVDIPGVGMKATKNRTFYITYTENDTRDITLGLWGDGYENWPGSATGTTQTQLLLRVWDWKGNEMPQVHGDANARNYEWYINIDGTDYHVYPSSFYSTMIIRFEPCCWLSPNDFIPVAGESYEVSLRLLDKEGELVYQSVNSVTITIDDDFEAIYWKDFYYGEDAYEGIWGGFAWSEDCKTVIFASGCDMEEEEYCAEFKEITLKLGEWSKWGSLVDNGDGTYTAFASVIGIPYTETVKAPEPPAPEYEEGDINGDSKVNISDVTALLAYLAASPEEQAQLAADGDVIAELVDVDGNGKVDISDVTALLTILAG